MKDRSFADNGILLTGTVMGAVGLYLACMASIIILAAFYIAMVGIVCLCLYRLYYFIQLDLIRRRAETEKVVRDSSISTLQFGGNHFFSDVSGRAWVNTSLSPATHFSAGGSLSNDDEIANQRWALHNKYGVKNQMIKESQHSGTLQYPQHAIPEASTQSQTVELLPHLLRSDRILLIGPMGAGKSSLLKHLTHEHNNHGVEIIVFDTHAAKNDWSGFKVVGRCRNYTEVEEEFSRIIDIMDKRYHDRSEKGIEDFNPLLIVVDELSVCTQFADISEQMKVLLMEARKVCIKMVCAGQTDRVRSLGIAGNGDLKAGFDAVVYLKKDATGYFGNIDGERYEHPGPFGHDERPYKKAMSSMSDLCRHTIDTDKSEYDTDRDTGKILSMFDKGKSFNKIAVAVFGSKGGRQTKEIKSILQENGRV